MIFLLNDKENFFSYSADFHIIVISKVYNTNHRKIKQKKEIGIGNIFLNGDIMSNFMNRIFMTAITFAVMAVGCSDNSDSGKTTSEEMTNISVKTTDSSEPAVQSETVETTKTESTTTPVQLLSVKRTSESELFSDRDLNPDYSSPTAEINLTGSTAETSGDGVSVKDSVITITAEGIYHITGTLDDGQIIVNADGEKVQLVLDNASINCSNSSAIYVENAKKVFITLADDSKNYVSDGAEYTTNSTDGEPDATIFSHDSLTINGNGELEVTGNYKDGIRSKDDIVITSGNITVNAVNNAIKAKDYVAVADGIMNLTAGNNGIYADNKNDDTLGFVYIEGGEFNITAGGGSSQAVKQHNQDFGGFGQKGNFDGKMPDGSEPHEMPNSEEFNANDGERPQPPDFNNSEQQQTDISNTESTESLDDTETSENVKAPKGIKASTKIDIVNGNFNINSADDSIHSNTVINISGGNLQLDAGDNAIHADSEINITGGKISITNSYEGIEATVINIKDGSIEVNSSDDGLNANDGITSQEGMGIYTDNVQINIDGGIIYVNASGDGIDSNGDIFINNGTIIVNGPENGGNGALDTNGEITVTGGTIVAAGMSEMAESPTDTSTQNSISATFDSTLEGGTLVTLSDDSGNEIISFAPKKQFDNIVISSPEIKTGSTYTFYTGGTSSASESYGLYENGGYNNDGTESGNIIIENVISYIGKQSMMGNFGGGMKQPNMSGMRDKGRKDSGQEQ